MAATENQCSTKTDAVSPLQRSVQKLEKPLFQRLAAGQQQLTQRRARLHKPAKMDRKHARTWSLQAQL